MGCGLRLDGAVLSVVVVEAGIDVGLLEGGIFEQLAGTEALAEEEVQVNTLDTVDVEVGRGVGTSCSNANLEDAQLVELHGLAFEQQLTQTVLHLHQHTTDGALGEHAVMVGHVRDELFERDALVGGSPVILHVALGCLLVLVLVLFVTDHGSEKFRVLWHYYLWQSYFILSTPCRFRRAMVGFSQLLSIVGGKTFVNPVEKQ